MSVMRARLRGIAKQTEEILEEGVYRLPDGRGVRIGEEIADARA